MIRCRQQYNIKCLKCNAVYYEMVSIGAFYMCPGCFVQEFGIDAVDIEPNSKRGRHYYKWLKEYKKPPNKEEG